MLLLFSMTSCRWLCPDEEHIYDRTVLVYMAAENSLSPKYPRDDINEMLQAAGDIPTNSRLIIYLDDTQNPRFISIERDQEGKSVQKTLYQYTSDLDSGDPETLNKVMEWTTEHYPAHSYGLVLWSHGNGWVVANSNIPPMQRSICIDNNQNTNQSDIGSKMDIAKIAETLSPFQKLEFIMFDACWMQSIEVAYELRNTTRFIIASPAEIPGPGAPYHRIIKPMFEIPLDANQIADEYFQEYHNEDREGELRNYGVVLSVLDCTNLENLANKTAEIITRYISKESMPRLDDLQRYCPSPIPVPIKNEELRPSYYDMNAFMQRLITNEDDYLSWKEALNRAIPYSAATPWWLSMSSGREFVDFNSFSGISCYVPQSDSSYTELNTQFRTTSWYTATGWNKVGW